MLKNTSSAINPPPAASESLASSAAVTPNKPFPLMLGSQASVLAQALGFLSARDVTSINLSTPSLNAAIKSPAFQALWLQHIQRDYPGQITQQPSQQAYYQAARLFQDQALAFFLQSSTQVEDYNYLPMKQAVSHFKTSNFKQRADYLTQWNKDLGLHQLKKANPKKIRLQGLTELTPEVMQRLTAINQKSPIIKLIIQSCYLPQLPEVLITFLNACTQLQELSLNHNQLQSLPETLLQTCTQLQQLYLNSNQLQSLPETLLQTCTQLKILWMNSNQLQSLPKTLLQTCTQLQVLHLNSNQLQSLPETLLQTCTQLKILWMNSNQLQSLPETLLQTCTQLQQLYLNSNQLQSLPETLLQTCTQLQQLYLNSNQLQSLPETLLQTCTQLQILWMNNNQLQSLSETLLQTCTQLGLLHLDHNHLMTVTRNDFIHLSRISFLNIESQTPVGASISSAIIPEQKMAENEYQPPQKKMRPNG